MQEIKAYKSDDGELFETEIECIRHEAFFHATAISYMCDNTSCCDCLLYDVKNSRCKLTGCTDSGDTDNQPCSWDLEEEGE